MIKERSVCEEDYLKLTVKNMILTGITEKELVKYAVDNTTNDRYFFFDWQ